MRAPVLPIPLLSFRQAACLAPLSLALLPLAFLPLISSAEIHGSAHPLPSAATASPAANPHAATAQLVHPPFAPPTTAADTAPPGPSWREANEAVAAFPRGHADIVAWEARQSATPPPATPHGHPPGLHGHQQPGAKP
jgi:hypothetical protein